MSYSRLQIFFNLRFVICNLKLFLILCLLSPALSFAVEKPVGKVIVIIGTVEYLPRGEEQAAKRAEIKPVSLEASWQKARFQQQVYATDKFRTLHGSRLKIVFSDNSLIALGPNSSMKVESYIYKPKQKLRQGLINVAHGLSMYIVNKSQKHKKSSFRIVTPTGNIAARGTLGIYLCFSRCHPHGQPVRGSGCE